LNAAAHWRREGELKRVQSNGGKIAQEKKGCKVPGIIWESPNAKLLSNGVAATEKRGTRQGRMGTKEKCPSRIITQTKKKYMEVETRLHEREVYYLEGESGRAKRKDTSAREDPAVDLGEQKPP